jgi:AraC-like DNA-binding protein
MAKDIINTVLGTLILLILFLFLKRNRENKFHLDFIIIHMALLIFSAFTYKGIYFYAIGMSFFDFINIAHLLSFVFLTLHVESALKGYRAKIKWQYFIPVILYLFITTLNYYGIYLLNYKTTKTFFLLTKIDNPIYFSDKLLVKLIASLTLFGHLFNLCLTHIQFSVTLKKKKAYKIWIYSYLFLLTETILVTNGYYFNFINPVFDETINKVVRINAIMHLIFFLLNPTLLNYLPLIKKVNVFNKVMGDNIFTMLNNLFQNEKLYLSKRLTIEQVANRAGFSKKKIQKAIFTKTQLNFNDFVNTYRVENAIKLMKDNYLVYKNLKSLASEVGFNSHQTFFRAFKKVKKCTPTEYRKNIEK